MTMTDEREGIADYRFVRQLGAGSHGVFYLAYRPDRLPIEAEYVAVKVLSGGSSQDVFRWAARELAAFAAVTSPYLVSLYDAGQQREELYYSMEYLPGGSLAAPAQAPDRDTALIAMVHAARAAHALHEAGIAHRDIKPGNILLYPGGAKLADLGLSHVLSPGITITRMGPARDIGYVDPGLLRGDDPSRASDVFSLGATMHYALTGEGLYGPLPADDPIMAMRRVASHPPVISEALDPAARAVIAWAIDSDPNVRPATALALADRIEELVATPIPGPRALPASCPGALHMLAMSRSTRSSTDRNGSLHSTVRCAWSFSFRCTQSTVKSRRFSWARRMNSPRSLARVVCGGTDLAWRMSRSRATRSTAPSRWSR
jgi:serine/threonine protein kinase